MTQRVYRIGVRGRLDSNWADWFDGWTVTPDEETTLLSRQDADQSALHGVLVRVGNLGLTIISVDSTDPDQANGLTSERHGNQQGRR